MGMAKGWSGCRLQVGADGLGQLETFSKRADAFTYARRKAAELNQPVHIYDAMARVGCPRIWDVSVLGEVSIRRYRLTYAEG